MKNLKKLLLASVVALLFAVNVDAATGSITASSSTKTATVGSTFTVTVKVKCSEALGSWKFGLSYDSAYVSLQSGNNNIFVADYGDKVIKEKTYTYKFKAIKAGNANIKITDHQMVTWDNQDDMFTPSTSNVTVAIKTQQEIQASYSKDNNLKSLWIEGYELSPTFDKDTTSYSVSVPETVTSVKVSAQVNDKNARLSGTGEVTLSEGTNKIEIIVTAQNGNTKTYTITVDVKDLNPISVNIEDSQYTVVKKRELLSEPAGYTSTTIKINDIEVPAFTNELTEMTLVGLKDQEGTIGLYIYDSESNSYKPYLEVKNSAMTLFPLEVETIFEGFKKTTIEINGQVYEALENESVEEFYIMYAMNLSGEKDYYIYDIDEGNFIKYNPLIFEKFQLENRDFKIYTLVLGSLSAVMFLLMILIAGKNSRLKKILKKLTIQFEEMKNKNQKEIIEEKEEVQEKPKKRRKKSNEEDEL